MSERVTHVGSYRVERELRRDERRIVYQGWQTALNRPVQITLLMPEAAADAAFVARWKAAARDLRDPGHPRLPPILDAQYGEEQSFLVETYLVADSLADQLDRGWNLESSLRLMADVASALAYAHQRGWAHGQLTADDVRLGEDGTAYLTNLPWQAAQRPNGDAAAMQNDVRALAELFCRLRQPAAGPLPQLSGWAGEDEPALAAWLAIGEPAEAESMAQTLAPVLAWALSGDIATAGQLSEALRPALPGLPPAAPLRPQGVGATIATPPPSTARPSTPGPAVWTPTPPPAAGYGPPSGYAGYPPPPPVPYRGSRRGIWALVGGAVVLLALATVGYLLCQTGALPFCASCNEGLIAQFVSGAKIYVAREAWDDAQRELELARAECNACSKTPAACAEVANILDHTTCVGAVDRLVQEGVALLANGDACEALPKLQQAVSQAGTCGADATLAQSLLARNSDGGAYTLCAQARLAQAEADFAQRDALCAEARELLTEAYALKPAAATIDGLYTQAERYATFRQVYESQQWEAAAEALDDLALSGAGQYCGYLLSDFEFEILIAQGIQQHEQGQPCDGWQTLQQAQSAAQSPEQQDRLDEVMTTARLDCQASYTPTPTPTSTATPTPAPVLSVTQDQANLRAGPGQGYNLLDVKAAQGDSFAVLCWSEAQDRTSDGWYKISLPSGEEAWLHQDLANISGEPPDCDDVPATPTPIPYCDSWSSNVLPNDQIAKPLVQIRAAVRDENNQPMSGIKVHVWAYETDIPQITGFNGETVWAGIVQPIEWNVCIYPKIACQVTPFTDNGQRANIEFRRARVPCN